jgi:hypothetical protein
VSDKFLQNAVAVVNAYNREGARPLVDVAVCCFCGAVFASLVQETARARRTGLGRICPKQACRDEARRRRQRGDRVPLVRRRMKT